MSTKTKPSQGFGYPIQSDELAAVFLALGFRPKPGAVARFVTPNNPVSKGGEIQWLFEGYNAGADAAGIQRAFEDVGDGKATPPAYVKITALIDELEKEDDIPPALRARVANALKKLIPEAAAAACSMFKAHLVEIHTAERPTYSKIKTGETSYEIRRA